MNLQELLGPLYREDMTLEEVQTALAEVKVVDKAHFDRVSSEVATYKKQVRELETQGMTEQQRLEQEAQERAQQLAEANKKLARLSARNEFLSAGLSEQEFTPFLDLISTEVETEAIKTAKEIAQTITTQKLNIEKDVKAQVLKETPKPEEVADGEDPVVTKEQFDSMGIDERVALKETNYELFKTLNTDE